MPCVLVRVLDDYERGVYRCEERPEPPPPRDPPRPREPAERNYGPKRLDVRLPWEESPRIIHVEFDPPPLQPDPRDREPDRRERHWPPASNYQDRQAERWRDNRLEREVRRSAVEAAADRLATNTAHFAERTATRAAKESYDDTLRAGKPESVARAAGEAAMRAALEQAYNESLLDFDPNMRDAAREAVTKDPKERARGRLAGIVTVLPFVGPAVSAALGRHLGWGARYSAGRIANGVGLAETAAGAAGFLGGSLGPALAGGSAVSPFAAAGAVWPLAGIAACFAGGIAIALGQSQMRSATRDAGPQTPRPEPDTPELPATVPAPVKVLLATRVTSDSAAVEWVEQAAALGLVKFELDVPGVIAKLKTGEALVDAPAPSKEHMSIEAMRLLEIVLRERVQDRRVEGEGAGPADPSHQPGATEERSEGRKEGFAFSRTCVRCDPGPLQCPRGARPSPRPTTHSGEGVWHRTAV